MKHAALIFFLLSASSTFAEEAPPCLRSLDLPIAEQIVAEIALGRFELDSAQALIEAVETPKDRACALEQLGNAAFYAGDLDAAVDAFSSALRLERKLGNRRGQAFRLKDLAVSYRSQGRFMEALYAFEEAAALLPAGEDPDFAVSFSGNLASLYNRLGARRLAIATLEKALKEAPSTSAWDLRMRLGSLYLEGGALHHAIELLERSAEGVEQFGTDLERTAILGALAWASERLDDLDAAYEIALQSLEAAERSRDPLNHVAALVDLGDLLRRSAPGLAEPYYREAIELARDSPEGAWSAWRAWIGLARCARETGDLDAAVRFGERGVALFEEQRDDRDAWEDRSSFSSWGHGEYGALIEILLERDAAGDLERAFELSEHAKARTFAEMHGVEALNADEILQFLPEDAALISYFVGASETMIFALRGSRLVARRSPLGRARLTSTIEVYHERLAQGGDAWKRAARRLHRELVAPVDELLDGASALIVAGDGPLHSLPFSTLIDDRADAASQGLLLQRFAVSTIASGSLLAASIRRPTSTAKDVLVVADPSLEAEAETPGEALRKRGLALLLGEKRLAALPASRQEARFVAEVGGADSRLLQGADATEQALRESSPKRFNVLHFAGHAVLDPVAPQRSMLVLSADAENDGLLQAGEIANLELDASLVVLGACRGADDEAPAGGAVQGLALSFLHAGARSVVASVRPVDDQASAVLLMTFYRALAGGASKAQALRLAQLDALERYGLEAPALWAPWVLLGEPTQSLTFAGAPPVESAFGPPPLASLGAYGLAALCLLLHRRRML